MLLLCDEDCGTGIPKALALVGYATHCLVELGWAGKKDTEWLPWVGQNEWLLFSYNKKQLIVPSEWNTIIEHKVGVVYLTSGVENNPRVLLLLLKKWETLELLWNTIERPFARFLHPNGTITNKFRGLQLPHNKAEQGKLI
ncbi:hypothetical protein ACFLUJ_03190 [Chloroflexota bacterium]